MILTINAGSSSIKFELYNKVGYRKYDVVTKGIFERIGEEEGRFTGTYKGNKKVQDLQLSTHSVAAKHLISYLLDNKIVSDHNDIEGIGHRIVNGGELFSKSTLLTDEAFQVLKDNIDLAPLHNPPAISTIESFRAIISAPGVAICDTSFHSTMEQENFMYPVPYEWYENHQVRRYGMHGISYRYILREMAHILNKKREDVNIIVCHLGNGASVCGIKNGKSVITSMGLTPLEGLMMGTRSGDIDAAMGQYVCDKLNITYDDFITILNKKSGLLAISGVSSDMRDIDDAAKKGNKRAELAIHMSVNRVCKYISYYQNEVANNLDAIVFTGGIGENDNNFRRLVLNKLKTLDLIIDNSKNEASYESWKLISGALSEVEVYAVRTNEELIMCEDVDRLVIEGK